MVCAASTVRRAREETTVNTLDALGWAPFFDRQVTDAERARFMAARVVWEARERYRLSTGDAEWHGELAGRLRHRAASRGDLPVVGDWVLAEARPREARATIHRTLERRTRFSRGMAGRTTEEQIIAANVDTSLLVTSFNRDFNVRRIERYLALTWESGARPIVVVNKADLCTDPVTWTNDLSAVAQGVPILVTSAVRGDGLADLRNALREAGTTALLGSSGVGKSTLVNRLVGGGRQETLPIRADGRGRHSTTARQLFCLPSGGVLIDTPGMRELQLWDADEGLGHAFGDVEQWAGDCRFRDCSHRGEPGCAVTAAVERGDLSTDRLDSYRRLQRENEFVRSRQDEAARVERARRFKRLTKAARQLYELRNRR
jgi:ribosome biogenesis GTPase / thiamine phosphate phosphatase